MYFAEEVFTAADGKKYGIMYKNRTNSDHLIIKLLETREEVWPIKILEPLLTDDNLTIQCCGKIINGDDKALKSPGGNIYVIDSYAGFINIVHSRYNMIKGVQPEYWFPNQVCFRYYSIRWINKINRIIVSHKDISYMTPDEFDFITVIDMPGGKRLICKDGSSVPIHLTVEGPTLVRMNGSPPIKMFPTEITKSDVSDPVKNAIIHRNHDINYIKFEPKDAFYAFYEKILYKVEGVDDIMSGRTNFGIKDKLAVSIWDVNITKTDMKMQYFRYCKNRSVLCAGEDKKLYEVKFDNNEAHVTLYKGIPHIIYYNTPYRCTIYDDNCFPDIDVMEMIDHKINYVGIMPYNVLCIVHEEVVHFIENVHSLENNEVKFIDDDTYTPLYISFSKKVAFKTKLGGKQCPLITRLRNCEKYKDFIDLGDHNVGYSQADKYYIYTLKSDNSILLMNRPVLKTSGRMYSNQIITDGETYVIFNRNYSSMYVTYKYVAEPKTKPAR